jgi:hypothetical protein
MNFGSWNRFLEIGKAFLVIRPASRTDWASVSIVLAATRVQPTGWALAYGLAMRSAQRRRKAGSVGCDMAQLAHTASAWPGN